MRNILILIIILLFQACNSSYRIQQVKLGESDDQQVEFLLPPKTKLTKKSNENKYEINDNYRYHSILLSLDPNDYNGSKELLEKFTYLYKSKVTTPNSQNSFNKGCNDGGNEIIEDLYYLTVKNSSIFIEFDFNRLKNKSKNEVIECFNLIPIDILKIISEEENNRGWPNSISQNIVKKIFEIIPTPQETVLSRYGVLFNAGLSFTMISPNTRIILDVVSFRDEVAPPGWFFELIGQSIIDFSRDDNGNIIQNPFLSNLDNSSFPSNLIWKDKNLVNLASSADNQLSSSTNQQKYVGLLHKNFKKNTKQSFSGPASCKNTVDKKNECNTILISSNNIGDIYECVENDICDQVMISSYGFRNLMTPHITILIDSSLVDISLNSKISTIAESYIFTNKFNVERIYNGKYYPLKSVSKDTVLLPKDKIRRAK